jgi:hypothetical protein
MGGTSGHEGRKIPGYSCCDLDIYLCVLCRIFDIYLKTSLRFYNISIKELPYYKHYNVVM